MIRNKRAIIIKEFNDITSFVIVTIIQYWAFKQDVSCFQVDYFLL